MVTPPPLVYNSNVQPEICINWLIKANLSLKYLSWKLKVFNKFMKKNVKSHIDYRIDDWYINCGFIKYNVYHILGERWIPWWHNLWARWRRRIWWRWWWLDKRKEGAKHAKVNPLCSGGYPVNQYLLIK